MNCAEFELYLCDFIDGTLAPEQRQVFEAHQRECAACAELARDTAAAVAFMERAMEVDPPAELLTRISFHIPSSGHGGAARWFGFSKWLRPVLQPRLAMGMAMTILSFSMLGRFAGIEVRQLKPSDLYPSKVWAAVDDRAHRAWARGMKYYESLRLVYEMQARLQEWTEQEEEERRSRPADQAAPLTIMPGTEVEAESAPAGGQRSTK